MKEYIKPRGCIPCAFAKHPILYKYFPDRIITREKYDEITGENTIAGRITVSMMNRLLNCLYEKEKE